MEEKGANIKIEAVLKEKTTQLLGQLGYQCLVAVSPLANEPENWAVNISVEVGSGPLIGKNGQNIGALEQMVRLCALRELPDLPNFSVDINDYRQLRTKQLVSAALAVAERVRASKKAEAMEPMSAYDRRLIHVELASHPDVETASIGEEPKRRVVIKPLII
ncbi:MAG: hypothetical protein A3I32_02865 [Candidatus Yanofskybacteria bacterium RIFCSPLOWO2_02_FULL_45_10]|uniref:R3H domain-containing protein n=2 Tax=Candidatus Yanofskyibacteriota TaxID=1752733 RepID=A0A1F8G099_9BACT|nr:MAG: hypothetical protein A3F25_02690 [Candidatus Yanofskybacteria bacterium RIFCSPHIGHO2_12_FULL_45_19b]OGN31592.1 MAG: hypothetical protein A3I32_02865 [Candidatus Yanofskybacteria bacterium RIFCSPLOWO2_02_FULL_45_10]